MCIRLEAAQIGDGTKSGRVSISAGKFSLSRVFCYEAIPSVPREQSCSIPESHIASTPWGEALKFGWWWILIPEWEDLLSGEDGEWSHRDVRTCPGNHTCPGHDGVSISSELWAGRELGRSVQQYARPRNDQGISHRVVIMPSSWAEASVLHIGWCHKEIHLYMIPGKTSLGIPHYSAHTYGWCWKACQGSPPLCSIVLVDKLLRSVCSVICTTTIVLWI